MIIKVKARPSLIHKGAYIASGSSVIRIEDCEQIHVDTGDSVVTYVRVPVPDTGESCCDRCHLSARHPGNILGICWNVTGCGMYKMHYIDAHRLLEDI